jgi:hypothetical protein
LALLALVVCSSDVRALDIKNVRATYGPFGAPRPANKMLPGDVFIINFEIANLTIDPKNGATKYSMTFQVLDPKGKEVINETTNKGIVVGLGGNTVQEMVTVILGVDQTPGKYTAKVTITDAANKTKQTLTQEVELLKPDFGFIHIQAPTFGLKGQDYAVQYALVGWMRDKKGAPKITLTFRVLDDKNKPTLTDPIVNKIPDDLPGFKADKQELITLFSPILLNRAGRFTVEIEALDELSKKSAKFSYPLTVVDPAGK